MSQLQRLPYTPSLCMGTHIKNVVTTIRRAGLRRASCHVDETVFDRSTACFDIEAGPVESGFRGAFVGGFRCLNPVAVRLNSAPFREVFSRARHPEPGRDVSDPFLKLHCLQVDPSLGTGFAMGLKVGLRSNSFRVTQPSNFGEIK